ncbi:CDP-diacylglycerol--glycerol-3-phosphate 3-phosphatidyltransferase [Prochlorococcus marinus]|uniref:CDP-diacylglycerol--glycerol-3-phosphate 3-phosphatidyltransferase n=1 Tax=Prochlorococcus marinus TaxID=1219 RepID=UPI0022B5CFC6|nr:CDP-diacylglycerol--glycerol-3-phosphate 3-phosphatidyltransferase [Prochlorococcus marinus]
MNKKINNPNKFFTWPRIINGLTFSRILLGLPIIILLMNGNNDIFIFLFLIAGITDFLDGFFARKYNHKSVFGAKLDPLADKILIIGPMIWLVHENLVPLWTVWLIISRELLITSWRSDKNSGGPASIQGKYKTTFQFASIILLLWPNNWGTNDTIYIINKIGYISFWIALFLTLSSAIKYIFNQKEAHQN